MSIPELKLKAIEKLATLDNENTLKDILDKLEIKEKYVKNRPTNSIKTF